MDAVSIDDAKTHLSRLAAYLQDGGLTERPFTAAHATLLGDLPWHHRNPFDRMLVSQTTVERLTIATADGRVARYGVPVL